jgi:LuxR family maltose regulon positive regulatory protein
MSTVHLEEHALDAPRSLLIAKLTVPKPRDLVVPRQRLFQQLTDGVSRPLTIVTGPAGSGKTTLLASWVAHEQPPGQVAWLTLDAHDDEPGVFWTYLVESLRLHGIDLPPDIRHPLHPGEVDRLFLESLAAALAGQVDPVVLVLDQFESTSNVRVRRDLDFVLRNAAPMLRLVVATRRDPGALSGRYLLRGELTVVRTGDLAFTSAEADALLRQHGIELSPDALSELQRHTEGWAAGLRLWALASQRLSDPAASIAGLPFDHVGLADYLVEEVLDAQPEHVHDFLLMTSVVDRVCPDLADALTGQTDGSFLLPALTRDNILIEPVDEALRWYRYHPLLAQVLRNELQRRHPEAVVEQHRRAARWFGTHADYVSAAVHAGAAGDWDAACAAVVRRLGIVPLLEERASADLVDVLSALPDEAEGAMVDLVRAAQAVVALDLETAVARLYEADCEIDAVPTEDRSVLSAGIALVRLVIARRVLDEQSARAACATLEQHLARLPALGAARDAARALGLACVAGTLLWGGDFGAAEHALQAALSASESPGCEYSRLTVLGQMAMWEYRNGRLREAARLGQQALDLAHETGLPARHQTGVGHLALSMVALEWNDRAGASSHLADTDLSAEAATDPALGAVVSMLRAFHLSLDGRRAEALATLAGARASAEHFVLPGWMTSRIAVAEAAVLLRCGDRGRALAALERAPADTDDWRRARAGVAYAMGDTAMARELIEPMLSGKESTFHGGMVEALLLSARLDADGGDVPRARNAVLRALQAARPEGRRRPFVEARSWLLPLITTSPDLASAAAWVGSGLTDVRPGPSGSPDVSPVLVEPLTERERAVLARMADAFSVADIAEDLSISVNTVKTHQRNAYRKLSVRRASDAVRRGRELQII